MDQPFSTHHHDGYINAVDYSPSGDQLAVGEYDGDGVTIYHPTTHAVIHNLTLQGIVRAVAYSRDGKYLAAGGWGKKVSVFETSDFEMVHEITFDNIVYAISFAADSKHMAVGGWDKKVHIFDTKNDFARIQQLQQEDTVYALSYSPDYKSLLIGLLNGTIQVINATDFQQTKQIEVGHSVYNISHSLTGKYIAVGSNDKTIIYEADNLQTTIKEYKLKRVNYTAFHPDGTTLTITTNNTNNKNYGINHYDTSEWNDDTPLFHAAATGNVEKLKIFDINYKGPGGINALMKSSENGCTEAVKFLLENGVDINGKNDNGKTALMYASERRHSEAVKLLFQYQADVGRTASTLALDEETLNEEMSDEETLDEEISLFLNLYEDLREADANEILREIEEFHKSPDEIVEDWKLPFQTLTLETVSNILLAAASIYNQTEVAKYFLETQAAMTQVMQNIPKYMKYIGPTFLQGHSSSDDLTKITKSLKSTEQGGNEILHEMVDDPSMAQNLKILVRHDHGIADVKNKDGKRAIDRAKPQCQEAMKEGLRLFGKFDVVEGRLLHSSRTACVFKVNRFDKNNFIAGNTNEEDEKLPIPTALKCMNDIEQVMAEIDGRKGLQDSSCIIALQAVYYDESVPEEEVTKLKCIEDDYAGDELYLQEEEKLQEQISSVISKKTLTHWTRNDDMTNESNNAQGTTNNDKTYKFVLVFNYADRSLDAALTHDRISHPDRRYLAKQILQDVGKAISDLHYYGRIHSDLKPLNIMCEGSTWKLIDLDVSCPVGGKYGAKLPSSGYCPPEVAKRLFTNERKSDPIKASVAHDLWSFGTIVFHVLTGHSLLQINKEDNLVEMKALIRFNTNHLQRKVGNVSGISSEAKDLLKKLLHPDPAKRLQYFQKEEDSEDGDQEGNVIMTNVLEHGFFDEETRLEKKVDNIGEDVSETKIGVSDIRRGVSEIKRDVTIIKNMTISQSMDLRKMEKVLLRAIYDSDEVQCPTTFIILNQELPDPPSDDEKKTLWEEIQDDIGLKDDGEGFEIKKWKKNLEQSKDWMTDLTSMKDSITDRDQESFFGAVKRRFEDLVKKETMYFYYVDELTGEPVRGGKDLPDYPFKIRKPPEFVPQMLPLIQVGMRAMSLYNGAAGVCQMFGFPIPKVPKDIRENMNTSVKILKLKSSVQMFKALHEKVEDGSEEKSNSLRGASLRELAEFIKKNDENQKFAGLHRIADPYDGGAIWTIMTDENRIKEKLEERAKMREEEDLRHNQSLLDDVCTAQKGEKGKDEEHRQEQSDEHESRSEIAQEEEECSFCIVC